MTDYNTNIEVTRYSNIPRYIFFILIVSGILNISDPFDASGEYFLYYAVSILLAVTLFITEKTWLKRGVVVDGDRKLTQVELNKFLLSVIITVSSYVYLILYISIFESRSNYLEDFIGLIAKYEFIFYSLAFSMPAIFVMIILPYLISAYGRLGYNISEFIRNITFLSYSFLYEKNKTETYYTIDDTTIEHILPNNEGYDSNIKNIVTIDLRKRARKITVVNNLILLFVVVILICSAGFIIFAGDIASKDTQSLSSVQVLSNEIKSDEDEIVKLYEKKIKLIESLEEVTNAVNLDESVRQKENKKYSSEKILNETLTILINRINKKESELDEDKKLLRDFQKNKGITNEKNVDPVTATNLLVAAGITRFGVLAITIYLVQILINLHRYNVKVASFYLAHADTLLLMDHLPDKIDEKIKLLVPDIDFGRQPSSLPEKVYTRFDKLAETAFSRVIKKSENKKT